MIADNDTTAETEDDAPVIIYRAPSLVDAEMVRGLLESAGIPSQIAEQSTEAYGPMLALSQGYWGEVMVPASFVAKAQETLAAYDAGQGRVSDEDLESAALESFDPRV